jgi:CRISPR/Cas system endoribonuclease Cas6 (RAMP superfamily)
MPRSPTPKTKTTTKSTPKTKSTPTKTQTKSSSTKLSPSKSPSTKLSASKSSLTWASETEIVGLEFELVTPVNAAIYPQYSISLHAWFLNCVRAIDPKLSAYLHDGESEKPFTSTIFLETKPRIVAKCATGDYPRGHFRAKLAGLALKLNYPC